MKKLLPLLLAALLLLACAQKPSAPAVSEPTADTSAVSEPTATTENDASAGRVKFTTTDLDGNPVDESVFADYDLVMLNFWAYWCPPCREEMPALQELSETFPNLLILGVIVDDSDMDATREVLETAGVTYPCLYPADDLLSLANLCQYIPTTFFLNSNGLLLDTPVVGGRDLGAWTELVKGYLK